MKYCLFCASTKHPQTQKAIFAAKAAFNSLDMNWMLEYDVCGAHHSTLTMEEEHDNISIWIEDESVKQLLDDCKQFTYERAAYYHAIETV